MKAYRVTTYKRPIAMGDVPEPVVGDHDVLVGVRAAGLNVLDEKIRMGEFKLLLPYKPPFALGHDVAGEVLEVGRSVTRFAAGELVFGRVRDGRIGTFAERIAVHEDDLATAPAGLTMAEAASVPLVALTAWQALVEIGDVGPGRHVFVQAGSGGVGTSAIQLAKHLGATVATTTGTSNVDWVRDLGADIVVDYRTQDFAVELEPQDLVLDSLGGDTLQRGIGLLRPGGTAIGITGPPDAAFAKRQGLALPLRGVMAVMSARARRAARRRDGRYVFLFMRPSGAQLSEIVSLIDTGVLRPVVDRTFPFDQTPEALATVAGGRAKGKIVVTFD